MNKKYSQDEINNILISKKLNEFYLAIIENRGELLTDEEYQEIKGREISYDNNDKEKIDELVNTINSDDNLKNYTDELIKTLFSVSRIRNTAILTMIDDEIYDIANTKFINLKRNKIINYDNLTNYYSDKNARVKIFTKEEVPGLNENTALIDVDNEKIIYAYEIMHINQNENDDLSNKFFKEIKENPYTLKKEY